MSSAAAYGPRFGSASLEAGEPASAYPVRYDVEPKERHRRLSVLFRMVLAVPHLVVLGLLGQVVYLVTAVNWLIILFSGRLDAGLWGFVLMYARWNARVMTYMTLLRDEYPPFGSGSYPFTFEVPFPERRSRLRTFFRMLLIVPQFTALYVIAAVWYAAVALAWFAILFSGRYPEGLRRLVIGLNRWLLRVLAYMLLLRDEYPPFSLGLDEPPNVSWPYQHALPEAYEAPPALEPEPQAGYVPFYPRPVVAPPVTEPEGPDVSEPPTALYPAVVEPLDESAEADAEVPAQDEGDRPSADFFSLPQRRPPFPRVVEPVPDHDASGETEAPDSNN